VRGQRGMEKANSSIGAKEGRKCSVWGEEVFENWNQLGVEKKVEKM